MEVAAAAHAAAPMIAGGVATNGLRYTEEQLEELVTKLAKLRDDIVAGVHPRLKVPPHLHDQGRHVAAPKEVSSKASLAPSNDGTKPASSFKITPDPHVSLSNSAHSTLPSSLPQPVAHPQQNPPRPTVATQLDPIFLTKADVLVRAEAQQKRHRLENALEEQVLQKKAMARHRTFDQDALPDFDVAEVLKRAQECVKPATSHQATQRNEGASSSDSFDENTFYSSQMNESTTTEEVEEPKRPRNRQLCRFFTSGKPCPYGESCIFPHDPQLKQKLDREGSKPRENDDLLPEDREVARKNHPSPKSLVDTSHNRVTSEGHRSSVLTPQQERIAELEAELRAIKEGKQSTQTGPSPLGLKDNHESQDDSAYSPPGPDEFGRDASLRERNGPQARDVQPARAAGEVSSQLYDFSRATSNYSPTSARNIHVIRNHITSPVAPQPARLSPLTLASVTQISQAQPTRSETQQSSRVRNVEVMSARQSPIVSLQVPNSRKRRRGPDSDDRVRNVAPRIDLIPDVRIKQEPISPDPLHAPHIRRAPLSIDPNHVQAIDTSSPQFYRQERVIYPTENSPRPVRVYEIDDRSPHLAQPTRRVFSRNGQHLSNEDHDLRRVVSERHLRAPISPMPQYDVNPGTEPRVFRAASHAYVTDEGHGAHVRGLSVQPQGDTSSTYRRTQSPAPRELQASPTASVRPVMMAPPRRRVLIDEYGNRFLEPSERQVSLVPPSRQSHVDYHYERQPPRSMSVHRASLADPDYVTVPEYDRRPQSPVSPQYLERSMHPPAVPVRDDFYDPRQPGTRVMYREPRQTPYYDHTGTLRDGAMRVQSVRPVDDRYELPPEQIPRVPSVRPQARIIQLGDGGPGPSIPVTRQGSVRPAEGNPVRVRYIQDDRPVYQYASAASDREYVPEAPDEGVYGTSRRIVQLM